VTPAPVVAAVLVNYNAGPELTRALQSIADEVGDRPWEGVVVDNASPDGSGELALRFAPRVRLVRNAHNVGFGRGVNQGVAATTAPVVLVMNPDCWLKPGALATLLAELQGHPDCGIVGPRILNPNGSIQGSARGDPDMLTGLFGRSATLGRLLPGLGVSRRNVVTGGALGEEAGDVARDAAGGRASRGPSLPVDWLSGACMLVRRDAFARVHGFDEQYFLYWEDADLCRRLRAAGSHVRYVPGATAVHRVGHSSRTVNVLATRAFHASAYRYYATHVAPGIVNPKRLLARVLLDARCWWKLRRART
jgi:GT2 family glycosyltransferase